MTHTALYSRQNGFSLIELMISMTIGLVVIAAAMAAYLGSSDASRISEAQSRMNEDAHTALTILAQHIRMAGNNPDQPNRIDHPSIATKSSIRNSVYSPATEYPVYYTADDGSADVANPYTPSNFAIRGCDKTFSNNTKNTIKRIDDLSCNTVDTTTTEDNIPDSSTTSDSIAVSYEADIFNTEKQTDKKTGLSLPTDCLGNPLPQLTSQVPQIKNGVSTVDAAPFYVAFNRFYIDKINNSTTPSLYCRGNGNSTGQALIENIENMQIEYGVAAPGADMKSVPPPHVAGYLKAAQFSEKVPTLPSLAARWALVKTVRICLVVRSAEANIAPDLEATKYINCEGVLSGTDAERRLRRAYTTTIALRNR